MVLSLLTGPESSTYGVFAQVFNHDGNPVGTEIKVNTPPAHKEYPIVCRVGNDRFVILYTSNHQDADGTGVYGQLFSNDGTTVGSEFRVNTVEQGSQSQVSAASFGDGFVAAWSDFNGVNPIDGDGYA